MTGRLAQRLAEVLGSGQDKIKIMQSIDFLLQRSPLPFFLHGISTRNGQNRKEERVSRDSRPKELEKGWEANLRSWKRGEP